MSVKPETSSFWCENSLVGVKTNFHVNLTCFHAKSTRFHTKVWCELNPCFFLMLGHATQSPISPRGLLPEFEEQSRTRGGQSGGVEDQPQY
jgi:hypothetical protein